MPINDISPEITVYVGVVSATHSAGKTTLVSDMLALSDQKPETNAIISGSENIGFPWFSGGLLNMPGRQVPIVVAPEAATLYSSQNDGINPTTDGYSFEHQIMIEGLAINLMTEAMIGAHELAEGTGNNIALALLDRSALDGLIYSRLLAPDRDQENISMAEVTKKVLGFNSGGIEGKTFPWRKMFRGMLRQYCDFVIVPEYREVELADNQLRILDEPLREKVDADIRSYYTSVLGSDRIHTVTGDRVTRVSSVIKIIDDVVTSPSN